MIKKKISCCKSKYFFNWGDIGSQNHRGFKCTSQSNIICTLHHVPVTPSKVSFCLHLPPLCPPPTTPTAPFPLGVTALLSVSVTSMFLFFFYSFFLASSFHLPSSSPQSLSTLKLSVCSLCPCLCFCFVH